MAENKSAVAMNLTDMLLCVPSRQRKSKLTSQHLCIGGYAADFIAQVKLYHFISFALTDVLDGATDGDVYKRQHYR